jgi:hypothetical protein
MDCFGKFLKKQLVLLFFVPLIANSKISLILRYDDLSLFSDSNFEYQLFSEIGRRNGSVLVGIIPFPASIEAKPRYEDKWRIIANYVSLGVIEIALHGYTHKHNRNYSGPGKSEFVGLSGIEQTHRISAGKAYLESVLVHPVRFFIPPYNSYDRETLKALVSQGFELISAGTDGVVTDNLRFLPGTTYPQDMLKDIKQALEAGIKEGIIVVTMHPYDFLETGQNLPEFRKKHAEALTLDKLLNDIDNLPDQVELSSVTKLKTEDLSINRFIANQQLHNNFISRRGLLPTWMKPYPISGIYYRYEDARRLLSYQNQLMLSLYGGLFFLAAILGRLIGIFWDTTRIITILSWILIIGLGYKIFRDGLYIRSALILVFGIGLISGYWISQILEKRKFDVRHRRVDRLGS